MSEQADPDAHGADPKLVRPGAITYLHISATDPRRAAAFYREVFDWTINDTDGDRPSFDDASGLLSGAWLTDHIAATKPGLLPYIYVADVAETVSRIQAHGGVIVTDPYAEGLLTVATFRDPAGNMLGLWHDTTRPTAPDSKSPAKQPPVTPVPEHLHTVTPRLLVPDAPAAIDFYTDAFGAEEVGERHCLPDRTIVHATVEIGDSMVMIAEGDGYTALLCTYWQDVNAAWERALAAGADIVHQLADQFYGERGGRLKDPFGQEWMLSSRLEKLTAAEIAARASRQD
jgi:uncharacterized glyoxalase superfamily protein PhnB